MPSKTKTPSSRRGVKQVAPAATIASMPRPRVASWAAIACAAAVFFAVLFVYLRTLQPTVLDGDTGELATAAHVLGVPHPTGYPMWTLLAHGFDLLPLGHNPGYRIALLSAISVAAGAGLLTWITIVLSGAFVPGVFAGLALGFWLPTWSQAVISEVYGLEALLVVLFLVAFWAWEGKPTTRRLCWLAFAGGIAAAHHRTGALIVLPVLAVALWQTHQREVAARSKRPPTVFTYIARLGQWFHLRVWVKAALCAGAPFLFYIYLPIRAAARPAMNWGDPSTWDRFLYHALGRQYSVLAFQLPTEAAMKQAGELLGESLAAPGWPSWLLLVLGTVFTAWGIGHWLRRRPYSVGALLFGSLVLYIFTICYGAVADNSVYLIPLGAVLFTFAALGMARLGSYLPGRFSGPAAAALIGGAATFLLLSANWSKADQSNKWGFHDAWVASLAQVEPNSIVVTHVDTATGVATYLQAAEGRAPGVTVLCPLLLVNDWYLDDDANKELRSFGHDTWDEVAAQFPEINDSRSRDYRNAVALFSARLAERYKGRRTVYSPSFPVGTSMDPLPRHVGLRDVLYRLDFAPIEPQPIPARAAPTLAQCEGVKLVEMTPSSAEVKRGECVSLRARWQLEKPLPGMFFALRLAPTESSRRAAWEALEKKACIGQGYPVLQARWNCPRSPAATAYEQRAQYLVPTNLPPGEYGVELSFSTEYPPNYAEWTVLDGVRVKVN